jgi:isoleucyl-tRNA synthetase
LGRTRELREEVTRAYEACQFHEAVRAIYQYCVVDLSGFYLDALKDRLYTEAADSPRRRYAQTSLYAILSQLVRLLAPILAVTTEEIWQHMREEGWVQEPSVHLARWPQDVPSLSALSPEDDARWKTFRGLREVVMKALETERARQVIGSPLEARVTLVIGDRTLREHCETHRDTLAEAFVVSEVVVTADGAQAGGAGSPRAYGQDRRPIGPEAGIPGLAAVRVERAPGAKCARCWKHLPSVGSSKEHPQLCDRCVRVVAHA